MVMHYIFVLVLQYMCPHTTIFVSSYYCKCVLILLDVCAHATKGRRHSV